VADLHRPSLRLGVGLAIVVLGLVEILTLVQTVRSHARERARVVQSAGEALAAARPALETALRPGGRQAWQLAAEEALRATRAGEAEVFDGVGQRLLAHPGAAPVTHWPSEMEALRLRAGEVVALGPVAGDAARVLAYAGFVSGGEQVVLRVSTAVPDLVEEMREHRQLLIGHALALLVVVIAGAMALVPGHGGPGAAPSRALDAYEAAMGRLRDEGQAASKRHDAERRRLEEVFKDREAMARAGELTAGIVHEVRNGLGTVVGYARLLEQAASVGEAREAGAGIRSECETLETVIRRFMEFVKEETLNVEAFDLGRMLSRVVARESRGGAGGQVTLGRGDAGSLEGDEALLERAFENLVRNAREAAGPAGHVWVDVAREPASAMVTVTDDGPGLTSEAPNMLRPFFTTKAGGLGLGLPLAFKIVRLHDGELAFSNRSPRGLRVAVRLPVKGPGRMNAVLPSVALKG
jgi:signal transduction histidine kinase